ncbi:MAG: TlpA disulfide reductase family protein [Thermoanaerobaculia bacterium]
MAVLTPGSPFPPIDLTDGSGGAAAALAGEALVGFFKTTCPTCEFAWPFFERVGRLAEGGTLSVLAVSQDEPEPTAGFNERLGVRLRTLYDAEPWRASEALGMEVVPTFFRVGADGKLRQAVVGFERQKMQDFAAEAAALAGKSTAPLYLLGENVPAIKPG